MPESATLTKDTCTHADGFCRQLLEIGENKLTGTLTLVNSEGASKSLLFHSGAIADFDSGEECSFLASALLVTEQVTPRKLRRAQKNSERSGAPLGSALLDMQIFSDEEALEAIQAHVVEEIVEVLSWDIQEVTFTEHDITERIEEFRSELSDHFDLLADPLDVFLEAAERVDAWDLVQDNFDLLLDVFYSTPGTFRYFSEPEEHQAEVKVLSAVDGAKDVAEVIAESGLDPFHATRIVRQLISDGDIELINPVQMFQLGSEKVSEGHLEKARKLFQRARDRGLNDFDIDIRLAETLEKLGHNDEAAHYYHEYSTKCLSQLRIDEAVGSLQRVVKIYPQDIQSHENLLGIFLQHKRIPEALKTAYILADFKVSSGDPYGALDMLTRLRNDAAGDPEYHHKIIELAELCKDERLRQEARVALARTYHEREDVQQELETYQKMFCEGDQSLEVRTRLIELHRKRGNQQKALNHINAILALGGKNRVTDKNVLQTLHETAFEVNPGDTRSCRWLVKYYQETNEKKKAAGVLKSWLSEQQKGGQFEEVAAALDQLIELEDSYEHRWALAKVLKKLGKVEDSHRELRSLANLAARKKEHSEAVRALDHILENLPLDLETRKAQVELFEARGEREMAAEKLKDLATLEVFAGHIQEAEECCQRFLAIRPDDGEVVEKLAVLCLERGDQRKAAEQFLKAARIHLDSKNIGLARRALGRLLRLAPRHQEGSALLKELRAGEERLDSHTPETPVRPSKPLPPVSTTLSTPSATPQPVPPSATPTATSTPRPSPSAPLQIERAPFQQTASVKTTVSGITARLRSLKSGRQAPQRGQETSVESATARLKALKSSGDEPASTPPENEEEGAPQGAPNSSPPSAEPASGGSATSGVKSAAARLKALAGESAPSAASTSPSPAGDTASPQEPEVRAMPVPQSDAGGVPGSAPPTAQFQQKLGASASRLAALRKAAKGS